MVKKKKRSSSVSDFILSAPKAMKNPFAVKSVGNPLGIASEPKRDKRRAFSAAQKKEILYQQNSKCAECHEKLSPRATQFDHKKPWASGGRTIVVNGRALCSKCHDIIAHKQRLKTGDKKRKPKNANSLF